MSKYLDRILNAIINERPSEHPLKWLELTYAKLVELFRHKIQDSKVSGAKHCGTTGLIVCNKKKEKEGKERKRERRGKKEKKRRVYELIIFYSFW